MTWQGAELTVAAWCLLIAAGVGVLGLAAFIYDHTGLGRHVDRLLAHEDHARCSCEDCQLNRRADALDRLREFEARESARMASDFAELVLEVRGLPETRER